MNDERNGEANESADETELLNHCAKAGSIEAMGELIRSLRTYLLLVANQEIEPHLRQKVAASDLVQDVCLVGTEEFARFRGTTTAELRGWFRQILLNSMGDSRRKYVKSQKRAVSREVALDVGLGVPSREISPRTSMIAQEESQRLNAAMERLSDEHQLVLRLRNWDLMPFAKIGDLMERSPEAAQKLWTRAVKRLEQELGTE